MTKILKNNFDDYEMLNKSTFTVSKGDNVLVNITYSKIEQKKDGLTYKIEDI